MKKQFKRFKTAKVVFASIIGAAFIMLLTPSIVSADAGARPYFGFGTTNGRTDTVNINDFHTNSWDRFSFNYQFHSGGSFRYDLGNPTTFHGHVQLDVYTANIRRDKNVAVMPPRYGVFSGIVATQPSNHLFPQPVNPSHWMVFPQDDPNVLTIFDTLQLGVNAPMQGNVMDMQSLWGGGLPSTSIGGDDLMPVSMGNTTGNHFQEGGDWFFQSGSGRSMVTTPSHGEFLPHTSIQ